MKNTNISFKNHILSRLVVTFLIIMVPIYSIAFMIYNWGINAVRTEIENSTISQVDYYVDNLEKEIQRIVELQNNCFNDEDLNKLSTISESMNDFEKAQAALRLQQRLIAIKSSSIYLNDVKVYIPSLTWTISATGGIYKIFEAEFGMLAGTGEMNQSQIIYWNNRIFLSMKNSVKGLYEGKDSLFIIEIEFSIENIEKALNQFEKYDESGSFFINPTNGFMIAYNEDTNINKQIYDIFKQGNQQDNFAGSIDINTKKYLITSRKSYYLNMLLINYIPEEEVFKSIETYQIWFMLFSSVSLIIIILFSLSLYKYIHKPLSKLVTSFKKLEAGDLKINIQHKPDNEFRYIYIRFNAMVEKLNNLIEQVYKQKILMQQAQLKQLQSQINPHFLYNSFFILHRMIRGSEEEDVLKFSKHLGNYFKFITRNTSDDVTLKDEVEHARNYAEIQIMRFSNRISLEFEELPEQYGELLVPRLIIQPIIENAFEHGLKTVISDGFIHISFYPSVHALKIIIEDNGNNISNLELENMQNDLKKDDVEEITGMINIHKRIQLKFGNGSGLQLSRALSGGLRVEINLELGHNEL